LKTKTQIFPLEKIVKEGSKLSTIAKAYLQDTKKEPIRKRFSQMEPPVVETKLLSYRERSKQRFTGTNSEHHHKISDDGKELS